jgi:thioesterase domain-containing protein
MSMISYVLIGASLGGLLANLVGKSGHRLGKPAKGLVLIDPVPPIRVVSNAHNPGVRGAATYLALHTTGLDLSFLQEVDDADLGIKLAARRTELGLAPFTERAVLEQQRELRATAHLLDLTTRFQSRMGGDSASSSASAHAISSTSPIWLVLATAREEFFVSAGLSPSEASADMARLYGEIAEEITLTGSHLDICSRCMIGESQVFITMLQRALQDKQLD